MPLNSLLQRVSRQIDTYRKFKNTVIYKRNGGGGHTKNITFFEEFFENCFSFVFNKLHKNKSDRLPGHT